MQKQMFVCSTCGFTAFVDRALELELAGWASRTDPDGSAKFVCSVCRAGAEAGDSPDRPPAASAPRARTKASG